jgi:heterodisulfide reductase subunit A
MEFERILSESGPYGGIIMRPYDGDIPKKIAFIQTQTDEDEFSPIAFKFLLQEAKSAKERGGVDSCIFARKIYADTGDVKSLKIHNIKVTETEATKNLRLKYAVEGEKEEKVEEFEMVVLSVGFCLPEHVKEVGKLIGVKPEEIKGRMPTVEFEIMKTEKDGVFIAV